MTTLIICIVLSTYTLAYGLCQAAGQTSRALGEK